ncbi:hypothetical protein M3Y99_00651000 [Aphelenchoides fujianensis]|nr:hypothetical protein M3Y99_00651000 [Aphelenchoides fujianensis]
MKSSLLFVLLLLVLLVAPSEAARARRHRQRKRHGKAQNEQKVLRIPFVRQTADSPQVVEVLVGTPPQKLKLAVTYGVLDSDKVITLINGADQVYDCPAGKNLSRYNPQASTTFEELPKNEEYGEPDHREKFAYGADPTHVHSFEFLHSGWVYDQYRCLEGIAGVFPLHARHLSAVWAALLDGKSAPIVTVVADPKPRIDGAFQTGELVIGGMAEENCEKEPKFVNTTDPFWVATSDHTLNGQKVQLNKEKWRSVLMAVDLSANQTLFEKKHWKKFVRQGLFQTDPTDGNVYVPCDRKQTFSFAMDDGERLEVSFPVDQSRRNAGGLCLLRVAETKYWNTLAADVLDDHCVHFAFHEKVGQKLTESQEDENELPRGVHQVGFSKRH